MFDYNSNYLSVLLNTTGLGLLLLHFSQSSSSELG